ncbi:MAG: phosphatidylglycerophosphatase A [Phycisphaerales bacterium]|nr:MAG: phosphatidylglycerophosphatase A [Phycisphaerales bacterium]
MKGQGLLLTAFGLGHLRPAPGTWGSTPPPLLVLLVLAFDGRLLAVNLLLLAMAAVFSAACVALGTWAEQRFAREDPPQVVADEVAGQCLALLFLPWRDTAADDTWRWNLALAITAFLAFRFFDILKPPPIGRLQRLPAGWGILADDLAAGLFALLITQALAWWVFRF